MVNYWANFAKSGNPNDEGLPVWNEYTNSKDNVMELGSNVGSIADNYLGLYEIIDQFIEQQLIKESIAD